MANFCSRCGENLTAGAQFCPRCGTPVPADTAPPQMRTPQDTGRTSPVRPANIGMPAPSLPVRACGAKSGLLVFLCLIMVVELVVGAFWRPGFLRSGGSGGGHDGGSGTITAGGTGDGSPGGDESSGGGNEPIAAAADSNVGSYTGDDIEGVPWAEHNYYLDSGWKMDTVASGILTEENTELREGKVSMSVNECFLDHDAAAEIRKADQTVDYHVDGLTIPLTMYEFNAEGIHDDTLITLEFPMEKPVGGTVGAGWYDEQENTIRPVHCEYDENAGIIRITTTHLSTFCGFPVKDENTRNCMIPYLADGELIELLNSRSKSVSLEMNAKLIKEASESEGKLAKALEIYEQFDSGLTTIGALNSVGSAIGDVESVLKVADGAGTTLMHNTQGTVGEIMNTMWGKSGSWGYSRKYGGPVTVTEMEDKLASVYPGDFIGNIGTSLNVLSVTGSVASIIKDLRDGEQDKAAWKAIQLTIDQTMNYLGNVGGTALGLYLSGVSLLGYALNKFYEEALEGRKQVYMRAYNNYYNSKDTDGGYRSSPQWMKVLREIAVNGGGPDAVEAEINRYCNEFWVKADQLGTEYLTNVMTKEEKIAWGAAAQGGLNDEIRKEITATWKKDVIRIVDQVIFVMNRQNEEKAVADFIDRYERTRREMNKILTIRIIDYYKEDGVDSEYAGCIVRFKGMKEKVTDPKKWQTVLNSSGRGTIQFRFLAHLMVNGGNVLEVVRMDGDQEEVLLEQKFKFLVPNTEVWLPERKPEKRQEIPELDLNMYRISETGGAYVEKVFEATGNYPQDTHITVSREGDVRIVLSEADDYVTDQDAATYNRFKRNQVELRGKVEHFSEDTDDEGRTVLRMNGAFEDSFSYTHQEIYGWLPREDEEDFANFNEMTLTQALPRAGDSSSYPQFTIEFYPDYNYCITQIALHGDYKRRGWYLGEESDPYEERSGEDCIEITLATDHP